MPGIHVSKAGYGLIVLSKAAEEKSLSSLCKTAQLLRDYRDRAKNVKSMTNLGTFRLLTVVPLEQVIGVSLSIECRWKKVLKDVPKLSFRCVNTVV